MKDAVLGVVEWGEALLRGRDRTYLIGVSVVAALVLWFFLTLVQSLWGVLMVLAISAGLGYAADRLYPARSGNGLAGAIVTGLIGALIGQRLFSFGPSIAGVRLIPAFVGILLVNWVLRSMRLASRARALDRYNAKAGQDPMILSKLEDYRILEKLGSGGSSKVYRAVPDRTLNEEESIAVKVFNEEAVNESDFAGRLQREIEVMQRLNHPHIMRVFKAGEQSKLHYLLMEFVQGETLSDRMSRGRMPLPEVVDLTIDLCKVLGHAHKAGVIHRDIKPDNIMMTRNGPCIMDFGLARPEGRSSLTQTGSALGTPSYMSPEQIRDDENLDARCDQYALGCVLFEMMTGKRPFVSDQSLQVMMKHLNEPLQDPRQLNPEVPDLLARCVWHMMAKDREQRFADMEAIVGPLEQVKAELKARAKVPAGA